MTKKVLIAKNKSKAKNVLPFFPKKNKVNNLSNFSILKIYTGQQLEKKKLAKKARNKRILNWLSFGLNLVILAVILIVSLSNKDATTVLAPKIDWRYMTVVICIVVLLMIIDVIKIFILIKASTKKSRPFLSYKTSALGKYYEAVTPMSSGGQPFQMLYMNKRGIRGDIATGIPLIKYIFWQITFVFICVFALTYNAINSPASTNTVATVAAWIVIAINALTFSVVVLLSISKKIGPKLVIGVLKLLSKMHIIKNYQNTFRKVMRFVVNYQNTFKFFAKNFFVLITEIALALVDTFIYNLIPFFIYKAFLPAGTMKWFEMFIQSIICNLSLSFFPTPGASGGAEAIFILTFNAFASIGQFWPVLIWRISTYYIYILQGFMVLIYDFVIGNKKADRLKAEGADIYNQKETFANTLNKNLEEIEVVQIQEDDKIAMRLLVSQKHVDEESDIIKNSDIISKDDMNLKVKPAVAVLNEVRLKDIQKKQHKRKVKIEKETAKKNNIDNRK